MLKLAEGEAQKLIGSNRKEIGEMKENIAKFEKGKLDEVLIDLLKAKPAFKEGTDSLFGKVLTVRASNEEMTEFVKLLKERTGLLIDINSIAIRELQKGGDAPEIQNGIKALNAEIDSFKRTASAAENFVSKTLELHETKQAVEGAREFRRMIRIKRLD